MVYRWMLVAILLGASTVPTVAKTVPFSKYGAWKISAGLDKFGRLSFCTASGRYTSGTHFSIIFNRRKASWLLQFYHRDWPFRRGKTPVILRVDGRELSRTQATYYKNSVFVNLGRQISRVKRLMRGRRLSVLTSRGRSAYSLNGSSRATLEVAKCVKYFANRGGSGGAFGGNPNSGGAFGGASNRSGSGGAFGGGGNNRSGGGAFGGGNNSGNNSSGNSGGNSGGFSGGGWQ